MITIQLEVSETIGGIQVALNGSEQNPTPQEKLFAAQMAKTIADFLNGAPKVDNPNEKLTQDTRP